MSSPKRQRRPDDPTREFVTPPPKNVRWIEKHSYLSPSASKSPAKEESDRGTSLSFQSFPEALPIIVTPSRFPDYSPMVPTTPVYCRVMNDTESPFREDMLHSALEASTLSVNSSFSRPIPDQSAFDTSFCSSKKSTPQRSPICPPTPVRQPSWIHDAPPMPGKIDRRSSLSTTKVLLTLPNFPSDDDGETERHFEFDNLGWIGSGAFADVYKMKSRQDGHVYAVKKSKRQFRSKRDRYAKRLTPLTR